MCRHRVFGDRTTRFFILALLAASSFASSALANGVPRLALLASGDSKVHGLVDLVVAEMTQQDGVELLDRRNIEKVVAEHKLVSDGRLAPQRAIQIGRLIACDVIAEYHAAGSKGEKTTRINLVVFDSATGLRLMDAVLPESKSMDHAVVNACGMMTDALHKWQRASTLSPDIRTVSIVASRDLDAAPSSGNISAVLSDLLARTLLQSPGVAVLERQHLEHINKESRLAEERREKLLAAAVRIDLEIGPGAEPRTLKVQAHLRDGSGSEVGRIEYSDSLAHVGRLASSIADYLVETLRVVPIEISDKFYRDEAEMFLEEMIFLERRSRPADSLRAEMSAEALAEAALLRAPTDVRTQKLVCYLVRRRMTRETDLWVQLAALHRSIAMAQNWPITNGNSEQRVYDPPTSRSHRGVTVHVYKVLHALDALPGGSSENDPRVKELRKSYGDWMKRLARLIPGTVWYSNTAAMWTSDVDEYLDALDAYFTILPGNLGPDRWMSSRLGTLGGRDVRIRLIDTFSREQKVRLYQLYLKWATCGRDPGRVKSLLCAAMLVNCFPEVFDDATARCEGHVMQAAKMSERSMLLSKSFADIITVGTSKEPPSFFQPFPGDLISRALLSLASHYNRKRIAVPALYILLDRFSESETADRGAFLRTALDQLDSQKYSYTPWDPWRKPEAAKLRAQVVKLHKDRCGQPIEPQGDKADAPEHGVSLRPLFEVPDDEWAILNSSWERNVVYLLLYREKSAEVGMISFDTKGSTLVRLGELRVAPQRITLKAAPHRSAPWSQRIQLSIGPSAVYAMTDHGLIVFPRSQDAPYAIGREHGLPSSLVTACCETKDELFVACRGKREGYILSRKTGAQKFAVLACSGRKEKRTCLDDTRPYRVGAFSHDKAGNRLFFSVMMQTRRDSWLHSFDMKTRTFAKVCGGHYFIGQMRPAKDDLYFVRIHSNSSMFGDYPQFWGYGLWKVSDYKGAPLGGMHHLVSPVMGSIHPDQTNWRGSRPHFHRYKQVVPEGPEGMALLDDTHVVMSNPKQNRWQIVPRSDTTEKPIELPLLDGHAPINIAVHDGRILATTVKGLWQVQL